MILPWNGFVNYFTDRKQSVKLDNQSSDNYNVTHGIGQGTILGPLIFLIVINDLYKVSRYSTILGFADDTTVYHVYHNLVTLYARIKSDLRTVFDWLKANKLTFNPSKTKFMVFSNHRISGLQLLNIDDVTLERCTTSKLLGIIIDQKLKFDEHLNYLISKLKRGMFSLQSTRYLLPPFVKLRLYYSFFFSHLNYCCESWGSYLATGKINALQKLQNNAMRQICKRVRADSVSKEFKKLKILNVNDVLHSARSKLMFRIQTERAPPTVCELLKEAKHTYYTRNSQYTYLENNILLKSLMESWERLPPNCKMSESIEIFKKCTKQNLLSLYIS